MTVDQLIALLAVLAAIVSTAGTVTVAIYTVRFQGQQESRRDERSQARNEKERGQQREWTIEDRESIRLQNKLGNMVETRREYLAQHKNFVDGYIKSILYYCSVLLAQRSGVKGDALGDTSALMRRMIEQGVEANLHVAVFEDPQLLSAYADLVAGVGKFAVLEDNTGEADPDRQKLARLIIIAAAKVTRLTEDALIRELERPQKEGIQDS